MKMINENDKGLLYKLRWSKIKYVFKRFGEERDLYVGKTFFFSKLFFLIDYVLSFVCQGASIKDYFAYRFYEKRFNGRNQYITYRRFHKIQMNCNQKECIKIFRDKSLFNQTYAEYLSREYIDVSTVTEDEFCSFLNKYEDVFVKEVLGFRGNSVWHYHTADVDAHSLFKQLRENSGFHYIVEKKMVQHESLASFHPASVNTIRIVTLYDDKHDKLHFMFAKLRMGNHGAYLDNTHAGGISGNIDIETGIINTSGYDVNTNEEYIFHPFSGKQIIGFQMPFWQECKAFVEKVARITPSVRYVGWDVVLLRNGEFALIEANDNADHDGQQIHYKGLWKEYKELIRQFRR